MKVPTFLALLISILLGTLTTNAQSGIFDATKEIGGTVIEETNLGHHVPGLSDFFKASLDFISGLVPRCPDNEFSCPYRIPMYCHPIAKRCDGICNCAADCFDEEGCEAYLLEKPCDNTTNFHCNGSEESICIPAYKRCNGLRDCTDNSDEEDCPVSERDTLLIIGGLSKNDARPPAIFIDFKNGRNCTIERSKDHQPLNCYHFLLENQDQDQNFQHVPQAIA